MHPKTGETASRENFPVYYENQSYFRLSVRISVYQQDTVKNKPRNKPLFNVLPQAH
ncbi:MAG: hypothetical protein ACM34N_03775 [Ignavibacteria bacterium]